MVSAIGGITVVNTGVANADGSCSNRTASEQSCTYYAGGGYVRVVVYSDKTVTGKMVMSGNKREVWLDSTDFWGQDYRGMSPKGNDFVMANSAYRYWRACASPRDNEIHCTNWAKSY